MLHCFSDSRSQIVDKSQLLEGVHPQQLERHVEQDEGLKQKMLVLQRNHNIVSDLIFDQGKHADTLSYCQNTEM